MNNTYIVKIRCKNCGDVKYHQLEKGKNVKVYTQETKCQICDCFLDGDKEEDEEDTTSEEKED